MVQYGPILLLIFISLAIAALLVAISYILAIQNPYTEKVSPYECGFDPLGDARQKFEVQFFLVGILFLIFDLEISFLFPWAVVLNYITLSGFLSMVVFLLILTIGFVYEWLKGGLEWQ